MRNDEFCLREILAATEQLMTLRAMAGAEERLREERMFRHAVLFEFIAIGEHAGGLSKSMGGRGR